MNLVPGQTVFIRGNPYPFTFKGHDGKNNPVLFGDFSNGFFGTKGWVKSSALWSDIINVTPIDRGETFSKFKVIVTKIPEHKKGFRLIVGGQYYVVRKPCGLGECLFSFYQNDKKVYESYFDCDQLETFSDIIEIIPTT